MSTRWAVLVGIDDYPNLAPHQQLRGCVNDAELLAETLGSRFGFPDAGITLLRNAEASRDGLLGAWNELVEKAAADDVVILHYSGHGSQMTDREGDEGDGLDETLVAADSGRGTAPNRDVTDDEIYDLLTRLTAKTHLVTLVFDCCHSGTATRDVSMAAVRRIEPDLRPASELPDSPLTGGSSARGAGPSGWLPPGRRYTLLAGCRDEEESHEYSLPGGQMHGALTWFLTRALATARAGASFRDVFEVAAAAVTAAYPNQHPQIEGAIDREVFGVRDVVPMRFVPVVERHDGTVTLGGGAAQAIGAGSHWGVYPAGTSEPDAAERLGSLVVTAAEATRATAAVEDETAQGAIAPQTRAVREGQDPTVSPLRVRAPDDPSVAAEIQRSSLLEVVEQDAAADARVVTVAPRESVAAGDPAPQLGPLAQATTAVVGADGRLLLPSRSAGDPATPTRLREDLETIARYRGVLALDNPGSRIAEEVELKLLRRGADGSWVVAEPEAAGGEVVYEEGEEIGLRIESRHTKVLYPALLDLGLMYAVNPVHPYAGKEALNPGSTVEVGTRPGEELPLVIPEDFPFGGDADDADSGVEFVKLLLTTEPADYDSLLQEGVKRDVATRDFGPRRAATDWGAVTRSFRLRRATPAEGLDPAGGEVAVGDVRIATPGLRGRATALDAGGGGRTRAVELSTDELESALQSESVSVQAAVELEDVQHAGVDRAPGARGIEGAAIEVRPPAPPAGLGQLVLAKDEAGLLTWHFAEASRGIGDERPTYRIERRLVVAAPEEVGTRGLVSAVGKKVLKVLVFPLVEPAIGELADRFAERWEAKKRPYRLRRSTPDDFAAPGGADVQPSDWEDLSGKRALLLVHGTFSRSHSGFGRLSRDTFEELHRRYEGRVLALDHFTLSHTPRQNVEWLVSQVPDGASLDVDIVCHSRGGLVSRTLAERQSELSLGSKHVSVRRVVFVATPNAGTTLADGEHIGDLIDTYTNVLNFLPDNGVTEVFEAVVTVAKLVAVGAVKGLDGLTSMDPRGEFQGWLNTGPAPEGVSYRALAADYEPAIPGLADFARDWLMDHVFKTGNDLVVPTAGVYSENQAGLFPIDERHVFDAKAGVAHTTFFSERATQEKLLEWLEGA